MSRGIVRVLAADDAIDEAEELASTFRSFGVLVLPRFLHGDPAFDAFLRDVGRVVDQLTHGETPHAPSTDPLDRRVAVLACGRESEAALKEELARRARSLLSLASVKAHPGIVALVSAIAGPGALLSTSPEDDALDLVMPGGDAAAAPPTHDAPRGLVTAWVNLGEAEAGVGGVTFFPRSHRLALVPQVGRRASDVAPERDGLSDLEPVDVVADVGDLVLLDARLRHAPFPNETRDRAPSGQRSHNRDAARPPHAGRPPPRGAAPREERAVHAEHRRAPGRRVAPRGRQPVSTDASVARSRAS